MRTLDDIELLKAYARHHSEAAFGDLVRRHLSWVYSVALRHVGNQALAEDVAQSVFVLLAHKAGSLRSGTLLGGWLFRTTRFVASRAVRAENRRKIREQIAASMTPSTTLEHDEDAAWKQLEPYLDQAVAALSESDRQAVLLRFYEKQPLLEVGRRLGLTEDAAKKRVSRAILKMREFLLRHGVALSVTVLTGLLTEQTVQAVPATLAVAVLKSATTAYSSAAVLPALARDTLNAWRWNKLKLAGGIGASLCGLALLSVNLVSHGPATSNLTRQPHGDPAAASLPRNSHAAIGAAQATAYPQSEQRLVHFSVRAKDSGEPIRAAPLAVNTVTAEGWKQRFDLSTGQNGTADILYPPDTGRLDVGVIASGYAARFVTWRSDSDSAFPTNYTLRVDRITNSMGGWLRDERGQPVAGAVVEMEFGVSDMAQEENPRERPGFVGPAPVTRSDRHGWWTCALVDPNARRIYALRARHPDFAPTQIVPGSWPSRERIQTEPMKLLWSGKLITTMNRGLNLSGRILTEQGEPIQAALIEHEPSSFDSLHTETDAQGSFAIKGLPPGDFDFIVTAPGFAQHHAKVDLQEGLAPVDIRLQPGGLLRLRLEDEDGNAIANGRVALTGPGGMYMPGLNWSAETGPDGRVQWTSAPTNSLLNICASRHPDFAMSRGTLVKADGEEHVIHLQRVFVVTGQVLDDLTGDSIRAEIKAFPGYGEGENRWYRGEMRRSTDGTYQVYFGENRQPWSFRIEADGYAPFVSEQITPASSSIMDVRLQPTDPSKTVRGTVWRPDGQPAAGAQVALLTPEHSAMLGRGRFAQRALRDRLILDANERGQFAFPEEPNACAVAAVSAEGFARAPVVDLKTPMDLRLQPWGRIEGSIDASARNRPVAYIMVDDILALNSPAGLRLDSQEFNAKPTDQSQFSFDFLPSGLLCVWLNAVVIEDRTVPPYHHPVWVQVKPGETTQVRIADTGCHVKGRFELPGYKGNFKEPLYVVMEGDWPPDSASPAGVSARQWMQSFIDYGRLIIAPDGTFESRGSIAPGTYRLQGRIQDVRLDQTIEVPNPASNSFSGEGSLLEPSQVPVVDLGNVVVIAR